MFLYPPSTRSIPLRLRQMAAIAAGHGKTVSVAIDRSRPHAVFADDVSDEPDRQDVAKTIADIARLAKPPIRSVRQLPARAAGSTDVFVLEPDRDAGTRISADVCAAILKAPDVLDVHVHASGFYVLRTKASKLTRSIDQIYKSGRIGLLQNRTRRAGKQRKLIKPGC